MENAKIVAKLVKKFGMPKYTAQEIVKLNNEGTPFNEIVDLVGIHEDDVEDALAYISELEDEKKTNSVGMKFRTEKELNDYMHGKVKH